MTQWRPLGFVGLWLCVVMVFSLVTWAVIQSAGRDVLSIRSGPALVAPEGSAAGKVQVAPHVVMARGPNPRAAGRQGRRPDGSASQSAPAASGSADSTPSPLASPLGPPPSSAPAPPDTNRTRESVAGSTGSSGGGAVGPMPSGSTGSGNGGGTTSPGGASGEQNDGESDGPDSDTAAGAQEQTRSWSGAAGSVVATCVGTRITMDSASPNSGYRLSEVERDSREFEVQFRSQSSETDLTGQCSSGIPRFRVETSDDDRQDKEVDDSDED